MDAAEVEDNGTIGKETDVAVVQTRVKESPQILS